jgi:hypothetical protein
MWLFFVAWLCLVLHDLEEDYPLFHPQNEGTVPNYAYYLCYRYPRPQYWVERLHELLTRWAEGDGG